jgi:cation:H+ antiporter
MSTFVEGVYFLASLAATLLAAAVFADRLDRLGERFGLPEALLGLLTAAGADAPELAVAVAALVTGARGTGLGVVLGSNVFNLGAMVGLSALLAGSVTLRREALALEGGAALSVTGVVCLLGFGVVSPLAALALALALLVPYAAVVALAEGHTLPFRRRRVFRRALGQHHRRGHPHGRELWEPLLVIPPAVAAIVLGSIGMVHASLRLADRVGLPHVLVGVLLLAVLTSLPNAYTGVRLGRAGRGAALVSETMNSNTINLVGGIVVPALFVGFGRHFSGLLAVDVVWLLATTAAAAALLWRPGGMRRGGGALLLVSWVGFAAVQGIFG